MNFLRKLGNMVSRAVSVFSEKPAIQTEELVIAELYEPEKDAENIAFELRSLSANPLKYAREKGFKKGGELTAHYNTLKTKADALAWDLDSGSRLELQMAIDNSEETLSSLRKYALLRKMTKMARTSETSEEFASKISSDSPLYARIAGVAERKECSPRQLSSRLYPHLRKDPKKYNKQYSNFDSFRNWFENETRAEEKTRVYMPSDAVLAERMSFKPAYSV